MKKWYNKYNNVKFMIKGVDTLKVRSFLKLVEIQTKLASVIPFLLGTVYVLYRFECFDAANFIVMLVSLLCFDMFTTTLNNYLDFKKARKKHGYNYERHNAIVRDGLTEASVLRVLIILFGLAVVFGVLLYLRTNIVVLLLGMLSFLAGISYSYGPVPISRTPFGEVLSGLFLGFVIPFLSIYIHMYDGDILRLALEGHNLSINVNLSETVAIFLLSVPTICCIANIMLANNICDIEDDIENRRYTFPVHIGREKALKVYKALYYVVYADVILTALLGIVPVASLLVLLTYVQVRKNISEFYKLQTKKDTFVFTIKNFVLICTSLIIIVGIFALAGLIIA